MSIHKIYHIPGVKVGCTVDLDRRKMFNENFGARSPEQNDFDKVEVLQVLINLTDEEAGDIEWAWADKFGYKKGKHYKDMKQMLSSAGKIGHLSLKAYREAVGHKVLSDNVKAGRSRMSKERLVSMARHATAHLTHEQRSANAKKYSLTVSKEERGLLIIQSRTVEGMKRTADASRSRFAALSKDDKSAFAKLGSIAASKTMICPHCNKEASLGNSKRWHFDNCKKRPV